MQENFIEKSENILEKRKEKIIKLFKNKKQIFVFALLAIAVILGVYIRSMPMQDHGGTPGLWDITTNTWTLGPDLDPWLFERYAEIIVKNGSLPEIDMMRNTPIGFKTSVETNLLPYMIAGNYYLLNIFSNTSVMYSAVVFPVIMFAMTIIVFFLFVREIFINKDSQNKNKANIIALISTFLMIVIPAFLSRTLAGIPEKESSAFFFMFLSFYLFLKAWKSDDLKKVLVFSVFAGITSYAMKLIWGGVFYLYLSIAFASLVAFFLNKMHKKEFIAYFAWFSIFFGATLIFSLEKVPLTAMLSSLIHSAPLFVFLIFLMHLILWKTKASEYFKTIKLPKNIISIIATFILIIILGSIFFGLDFLFNQIKNINQIIFKPTYGRWSLTVAESRQPHFTEWVSSFGPFMKNIPVLFWLFFIGSVALFKEMFNKIKSKDSWVLTTVYVIFLAGITFSRYSDSSILTGENFASRLIYYSSLFLLIGFLIYYYSRYNKENDKSFESIEYSYLLLFILFILGIFGARSAVRLVMVLAPISTIFVGYLLVSSIEKFKKTKEELGRVMLGILVVLIFFSTLFVFWTYYEGIKAESYSMVPSMYNQQWQKAMKWVREETPENSVFSHWWDYGYWLQSIGNRATVLDGGNYITYWNYLMGRLVLTGDNQKDALEYLYNHNATHLLIDSSDIGKYGAFSSIGSNENYDRYSWIPTLLADEQQTRETQNEISLVYSGGTFLDEDLIIKENEKEVLFPQGKAGVGALILTFKNTKNLTELSKIQQPEIVIIYQGLQYRAKIRYLYINEQFIDFGSGINSCAYLFPRLISSSQGISSNPLGAAMYLSPRLMRGMFSQLYLLDDSLHNFPNFKLIHSEPNFIINDLNNQGMNLPEFIYYSGVQGPIKIWTIEYTGEEQIKQEYLDSDASKYLSWKL